MHALTVSNTRPKASLAQIWSNVLPPDLEMCEGRHGWKPVPERITEAKGEKMGREAFWPDQRRPTVMVDGGLEIKINVASDHHTEAFFIA